MTSAYIKADDTVSARRAVAVTPSDATSFEPTRGLYIGAAGNVAVSMVDGGNATFVGVAAGSVLPVQVTKVLATGTTATSVLALY
jgi:hypothetical protein